MSEFKLVYDYKDETTYRESFFELALKTFGINFRPWYESGCWNDNYVCYSYVNEEGTVVSNISINKMDLVIQGKETKAIQVGTVMTDEAYRKKGLARKLMEHIIEKYEDDYAFFYLSANETVLDFYPRFGFQLNEETEFRLPVSTEIAENKLQKLSIDEEDTFELIKDYAKNRVPVSNELGVFNDEHLILFYTTVVFSNMIYYSEQSKTIVYYYIDEAELHLLGVLSKEPFSLEQIIQEIITKEVNEVVFHFTPDIENARLVKKSDRSNDRFIRPADYTLPKHFVFPQLSQS